MRDEPRHAASRSGRAGKRDSRGGTSRRERGDGSERRPTVPGGTAPGRTPPDAAELAGLLDPVIRAAGMDLESVRVAAAGRRRLLRVVVDADGGVGLDDIADVSREISARLDARAAMGDIPYTLEVSSPGVDRPLTEPRHWRRARGRLVSATLAQPPDEGHPSRPTAGAGLAPAVTGRVVAAGEAGVTLDVAGQHRMFSYAELGPGRVQVEFGKAGGDEPGGGAEPAPARSGDGGSPDGY